ncbi:MAG: pyrimidine 5'-nucleotidase [Neisseriaceae bacterium]|nr:pyrimidine 5'-nucleotidase [Neisseriaceae bacterium]MBP6862378.1 pyrimidine 5'-nucleotidase [Neisseriaceae bacterium]
MTQPNLWLFDLDNTLHDADAGIFECINHAMTAYMAKRLALSPNAASDLRADYWQRYGATLYGLQHHHPDIDVQEFLDHTHPLDAILPLLTFEPDLATSLQAIPGRKVIFSNAPSFYIDALCQKMAITHLFAKRFGTDTLNYAIKPSAHAYQQVYQDQGYAPEQCIMVDDSLPNLEAAKALGLRTVWHTPAPTAELPAYVDVTIASIAQLSALTTASHHAIGVIA